MREMAFITQLQHTVGVCGHVVVECPILAVHHARRRYEQPNRFGSSHHQHDPESDDDVDGLLRVVSATTFW
jgi:hypothetical protein